MSDTPRTDELDYNQEAPSYRIWDLARELERELNFRAEEARIGNIALENLRGELDLTYRRWREAEASRDEWMTRAISKSTN